MERAKILIVDDKTANLTALEKVLADLDAEFIRATSGNEALTQTLEHEFALALIDVQMPGMDGFETLSYLRQNKSTLYLPVIFISAIFSDDFYKSKGIKNGAVDFISKPLIPEILIGKVKIFLDLYYNQKKLADELVKRKQAELEANAASKAKSDFIARMSHELRTPLNGIVGMVELLMNTKVDRNQKKYLDLINDSADNLKQTINEILDFSVIEAGQLSLHEADFNLQKLIDSTTAMYKIQAEKKQLAFHYEVKEISHNHVYGDSLKLQQILVNIISNAIKYTDQGHISLTVKESEQKENMQYFEFILSDTGIGIPKAKIHEAFDSFKQFESDYTKTQGGIGLGLAIVKSLTEIMKGTISLESDEKKGTAITLTIPFRIVTQRTTLPVSISKKADIQYKNKKILVAEDDSISNLFITTLLIDKGFAVDSCFNGEEAFQMIEDNAYDLILMDIGLPVLNGLEVTKKLRNKEHQSGSHIPVIALTAYTTKEDVDKCLNAGVDKHIAKPLETSELFDQISSIFYTV